MRSSDNNTHNGLTGVSRARTKTIAAALALALMGGTAIGALPGWASADSVSQNLRAQPAGVNYDRSYSSLVEAVMPAVVNVQVEKTEQAAERGPGGRGGPQMDPEMRRFFERFFGPQGPQGPQERQGRQRERGEGSGFVISADGHIVTNAHVVGGADKITVVMQDGTKLQGKMVGIDEKTDLALVKVEAGKALPFVSFGDSSTVKVGDKVVAVGNPFGLGGTVTSGIVSATKREIGAGPYEDFLQVDAAINRGNSGGPTFNLDGEVVGVNSMIYSPSGGSVGIGFAISANLAKQVVTDLMEDGKVERGWLGVAIQPIDEDLAASLGLKDEKGALVSQVEPGSPAEKSGIQAGDVVTMFNGQAIDSPRALSRTVADVTPGTNAQATIWRNGAEQKLEIGVGEMAGAQVASAQGGAAQAQPRLGLTLAPLNKETRERMELPIDAHGVLVQGVAPDSPAAEKGIREGDLVVSIAGKEVQQPREVSDAVRKAHEEGRKSILMVIEREGRQMYAAIPLTVS